MSSTTTPSNETPKQLLLRARYVVANVNEGDRAIAVFTLLLDEIVELRRRLDQAEKKLGDISGAVYPQGCGR